MSHLLLLFACASPPGALPDAEREYVRLLATEDQATGERIEACLALPDPALAGDCALAAAEAAPTRREGRIETWCPRLPEGVWRDECLFQAAERALAGHDRDRAVRLCRESGRFLDECGYHLWQVDLRRLVRKDGPWAFADRLPEARALYDSWSPHLEASTDMERRFWDRYFEMGFEPTLSVDLGACDPLEEPFRARCRQAGAMVWRKRLELATTVPEPQAWFCTRTAGRTTVVAVLEPRQDVPQLPGKLDTHPSPDLDEVVAGVRSSRCR